MAKKGLVDNAMQSKPVVATKDLLSKATAAVTDAFMDPPLAVDTGVAKKTRRVASKRAAKKSAPTPAKKMDRKLVSAMEDYEVKYLALKHKVTQKAVKAAVAKVGNSRNKVEAELKKG